MTAAGSFGPEEYAHRRARVRAAMADRDVAVLVVTAPEDVYYLSGLNNQGHFMPTALVLAAASGSVTLVAREMERPTAEVQAPACAFAGYGDATGAGEVLCEAIAATGTGGRDIGYQPDSLSFPVALWRILDSRLSVRSWVDCGDLLNDVRAVRTDAEVACLREAAWMSDIGMRAGMDAAAGRCSGGEVVGAAQHAMLAAGSDYPGFVPLVRSVEQIRQEHVAWTPDPVAATETLFLELSGACARYHAPLARTVPVLGVDTPQAAEVARSGLDAILYAMRPGGTADDVYRAWSAVVEEGLGRSYERHHCGYLVGIGFPPSWMSGRVDSLRAGNPMVLRTGMTFHIQSWVLDERVGTYAVSDTALVTPDGSELLTATPHHPHRDPAAGWNDAIPTPRSHP